MERCVKRGILGGGGDGWHARDDSWEKGGGLRIALGGFWRARWIGFG